jgi:beta-mannosidase
MSVRSPLLTGWVQAEGALAAADGLPMPDGDWLQVALPFDLHRCLERSGRLAPVDHGVNVEAAAWVEDEAWWCVVDLPAVAPLDEGERCRLVFEGLDTVVEVWLDGEPLGRSTNMFRPAAFDIGPGPARRVHLRFEAFAKCDPLPQLRKAQFSAGWDFAPRRPGVGVWQPAYLVREQAAALAGVGFRTVALAPGRAHVEVEVDVEAWTAAELEVAVRLTAPDGRRLEAVLPASAGRTIVPLLLDDPTLWWTHDLGDPALHALHVSLRADGAQIAAAERQVGVRTVVLDRDAGAFRFLLNGEPIAVRGFNWVPCDTALGEVAPSRYPALLEPVRAAHGQLVRVWGGGSYEPDAFYDTCDRLGLLVWQDFMFACADYRDDDPAFVQDVVAEARYQVRRLRAHPSLALWCGNNEVELIARLVDWENPRPADRLFSALLPEVVAAESPGTPYTSSSPCSANRQDDGDRHTWEVWHGLALEDTDRSWVAWSPDTPTLDPASPEAQDFARRAGAERYLDDECRFVSEYGLCGMPALATLAAWTDPEQLRLGSRQVSHRQRPGRLGPLNKLEVLMAAAVGSPTDLAEHVELSRLLQAEGLKTGAEHYRRRWPDCAGQIVWQLDDCWPAISWSLIDVAGRPKPGYYAIRRAYSPVLASFRPTADGAQLWLTNNTRADVVDVLDIALQRFDGEVLDSWTVATSAQPASSRLLQDVAVTDELRRVAYLLVTSREGSVPVNRQLLAPVKDLQRPPPTIRVTAQDGTVTLESDAFALMVHVEGGAWQDDYLDVHPGRPVLIGRGSPGPVRCR